jgi:hypothetical protein
LPQVKIMQAVHDHPLGMPVATDVVSGEKADDPLYVPCIERVQQSLGRGGLLFVGDCKMASRETRSWRSKGRRYRVLKPVMRSEQPLQGVTLTVMV